LPTRRLGPAALEAPGGEGPETQRLLPLPRAALNWPRRVVHSQPGPGDGGAFAPPSRL